MRIGYPNINYSIGCRGDKRFQLASYSDELLRKTVRNNLDCLLTMLRFNVEYDLMFFRIHADLVPFASHPICTFSWREHFQDQFGLIGEFIREHHIRISTHPSQFVLLNSPDPRITERSHRELRYLTDLFNGFGLPYSAKIQIHVGGVYGDRRAGMEQFVSRYRDLSPDIRRRLVIENDDRRYTVSDCLRISGRSKIPVVLDVFHHHIYPGYPELTDLFAPIGRTWSASDGLPMVDYSSQEPGKRPGTHAGSLDREDFRRFLEMSRPYDMDVMLEIKDKEVSALRAVELARQDPRFVSAGINPGSGRSDPPADDGRSGG